MPITAIYGPADFGNRLRGPSATPASYRVNPTERAQTLPMPSLEWTPEVERATAHLYERVKTVIPPVMISKSLWTKEQSHPSALFTPYLRRNLQLFVK